MSSSAIQYSFWNQRDLAFKVKEDVEDKVLKKGLRYLDEQTSSKILKLLNFQSDLNEEGYPIVEEAAYKFFLDNFSYLFLDGLNLYRGLKSALRELEDERLATKKAINYRQSLRTFLQVIKTAAITSPSDLWVTRNIISALNDIGLSQEINKVNEFNLSLISKKFQVRESSLEYDLNFLVSRGYLLTTKKGFYKVTDHARTFDVFKQTNLNVSQPHDEIMKNIKNLITTGRTDKKTSEFLSIPALKRNKQSWIAGRFNIEIGFRLVPLILSIHESKLSKFFKKDKFISDIDLHKDDGIMALLYFAGIINSDNKVTEIGEYIFSKGPGPMGIIHSYHPYFSNHSSRLKRINKKINVQRKANIQASQTSNKKSFLRINQSIDLFCEEFGINVKNYIEHALGEGEATKQRFQANPNSSAKYFGADLEDAAIEAAQENHRAKMLPPNMKFISNSDIGAPKKLIKKVKENNDLCEFGTFMVVGNGFHEIRNQTNRKMKNIFRTYSNAGIILCFTEEIGLSDIEILKSGWNTYQAGFKYVHHISGQGLRHHDKDTHRDSWSKLIEEGDYIIINRYTYKSRTSLPCHSDSNTPISVSYFCIPKKMYIERHISS